MTSARLGIGMCCLLGAAAAAAATPQLLTQPGALETFVDGVMANERAAGTLVGAGITIVQDGRVRLARGYGYADLEAGREADGEQTLFRLGGVAEALIWIAVAQQVQEGHLALADEVNSRLASFQIPATFPEPIRLWHLLGHSAGFDPQVIGLYARGPGTLGAFDERLAAMLPPRVERPGLDAIESPYGTALAARLVERVAGEPWDDYAERRILGPLRMTRSSTRQPPPAPFDEALAEGYEHTPDGPRRAPFEYATLTPTASVSATPADMGRLLVELLRSGDSAVLSSRGRALLFEPGVANDDRLNRMLQGFYQRDSHGQRIVGQHGALRGFRSGLLLYPELRLGLFVGFNSDDDRAVARVTEAFNDQLFRRPRFETEPPGNRARPYVGYYASLATPGTGPGKLYRYVGLIRVDVDPEGWLRLADPDGARPTQRFGALEPEVFQAVDGSGRLAFRDGVGDELHLSLNDRPYRVYERLPRWLEPPVQLAGLAGAGLLIAGIVTWPFGAARRSMRERRAGEGLASVLAVVTAGILVTFFVMLGGAIRSPGSYLYGLAPRLEDALWLPVVAAPPVLLQLLMVLRAWTQGFWWPGRRIHYTLLTIACAGLVGWCAHWNLVAVSPAWLGG